MQDPHVNYLEPRITESRFAAYLAPYRSEDVAREELIEAGTIHVEAEAGRKRRGR